MLEGVWSVFHSEVGGGCLAWLPLRLHGVGVGVGHLEVIQCLGRVPCTHVQCIYTSTIIMMMNVT